MQPFKKMLRWLGVSLAASLACVLLTLPSMAVSAPVVILVSNSDKYAAGDILDDADVISLTSSEAVTLNQADGVTRQLTGPYSGPIGAPATPAPVDGSLIASLSRLAVARDESAVRLGAVRSMSAFDQQSPSAIDVATPDQQCLELGDRALLVRPERYTWARIMRLRSLETGQETDVVWQARSDQTNWPREVSPGAGGVYAIYWPEYESADKSVQISIKVIDPQPNDATRAAVLEQEGCTVQALMVFESLLRSN